MMERVLFLFVLLVSGAVTAQDDSDSSQLKGWDNLYDWYGDGFDVAVDPGQDENSNNKESNEVANNYEDVDDDQLFEDPGEKTVDEDDLNNDYQIEDNRSAPNEEEKDEVPSYVEKLGENEEVNNNEESKAQDVFSSEEIAEDTDLKNIPDKIEEKVEEKLVEEVPEIEEIVLKENDQKGEEKDDEDDGNEDINSAEISFDKNSDLKPMPLPPVGVVDEDIGKIIEETQKILHEDQGNDFADDKAKIPEIAPEEILKETQKLLDEIDNTSGVLEEALEGLEVPVDINKDELELEVIPDEDTVDKAYQDLNEDLDKLMETWRKLSEDDIGEEKNPDDSFNIADYEEKYGRPFREGIVLSQRDDYYESPNGEDKTNDKVVENGNKSDDIVQKEDNIADNEDITQELVDDIEKKYIQNNSDQISKIIAEIEADEVLDPVRTEANPPKKENVEEEKIEDDEVVNNDEKLPEKPIMYVDDALTANENEETQVVERQSDSKEDKVTNLDVHQLNSTQYDQIMEQFKVTHKEEMDVISESLGKSSVPQRINFTSLHEVIEVTSPNYPNAYPTNSVVDWIFDGEGIGMGIEMNITDFSINGVMGEYLLVKPGGVDESGNDGLLFSYGLNEPRRYRFLDVDRMFVRFVAPGLWPTTLRGFKFTLKMVAPVPRMEELLPEPEPIIPEHEDTHTVYLGLTDMNVTEFKNIEEEFRVLLADMATMYINANGIRLGMNTTLEVTRITGKSVCHLSWPDAHRCIQVTFAVPLNYDNIDEELPYRLNQTDMQTMWNTYSRQDPFASRLSRMQVSEFASPDDRRVLTSWAIVGFGILVTVLLLIISLWRYSCFDNYSRMPVYEEEDYMEKRGLDLYPTPHQTLPPLHYNDYEWTDNNDTTRVDMGGFTNRSFEDDIRDRNAAITSKPKSPI